MKNIKINKLNFRRFEFKYTLPAKLADIIIGSISNFVIPDPFTQRKNYYYVNSIYFDTQDFFCYKQKEDSIKNRKKYRIRYYGNNQTKLTKPLFFEIKRKIDSIIVKDRVTIKKEQIKIIDLNSWKNIAITYPSFFTEFYADYKKLKLKPKLLIQYKRKPFFSKHNKNFRITFDYDISASKIKNICDKNIYSNNVNHESVIMEIKFNGIIPPWFTYIIKSNNLNQNSFSKYYNSIKKVYNL